MRLLSDQEIDKVAGGRKNGFGSESGQGNLDNENTQDPANPGTATESGPRGVLKNDKTSNPNYVADLPGKNR